MGIRLAISLALLMWHSVAHAVSFTVTNTEDAGPGSLRQALINASNGGTNTILISATGTIALASPLPMASGTLTISGPGADKLTIQGSPGPAPVLSSTATLQVSGVTITGGANAAGNGGGIQVMGGSLTLLNSTITGNTAALGGGIYSTVGSLTILSSTISGNTGTGAIYSGNDISVFDSTIADNQGTAIISTTAGSILSIDRSTISGNTDAAGIGGIQLQGGTANIRNTTFSGNSGPQGGDFWTSSDGVSLKLINVTAIGGSAPALLFDHAATVMLRNTLLAGTGTRCSAGHLPTSQGHNLSSDTTCNLTQTTDKPGVDPLLGPLAANGGPSKTHAPLAGSPVLNAGDGAGLETTDQRGVPRIQFAAVDIGAVEVSEPMVVTQPMPQTVAEGDMFTLSVAAMNQNSTTPLKYQWRKDGTAIAGATGATFTNPAAAPEDAGMYDVLVINDGGGLPSMAVAVNVTPAPKPEPASGGCCSSTADGAAWTDAVLGLGLVALLGVPRRRRAR
ncbi:MAG TPA: choice-of-anchor Q domain-containing protein [Kofleriaceae bacterium]